MPRVLLLGEYGSLNGGERSLLAVVRGLQATGFALVAEVPQPSDFAAELGRLGVDLVPLRKRKVAGREALARSPLAEHRATLREVFLDIAPDLIHANSLSMSRRVGPVAAELGIPSLGHIRDIVGLSRQAIRDVNANTRLLAVSNATREWHVAAGIEHGKVHVAWNGVDPDQFCPRPKTGALHRELGLPMESPLLLTVGQVGIRKGWDEWLEAAPDVIRRFPGAHLVLVGRRYSEKDEAVRFERDLHERSQVGTLDGHCHFLGVRGDVDRLLNEADVLVHPARQEPLGRVLLEAAAAGTPVVATSVGGTAEIFPVGSNTAQVVPSGQPAALADGVSRVLADARLRHAQSRAARRRIEVHFSQAAATQRLVEHYRAVVA